MDSIPLISIVTPSFNQARYLENAMQSVLAQDYPLVEYFVVDGGSTDGSVDIIRRMAAEYGPRLKWWVSEKDQGQADAINKGLSRVSGQIVAWLNSDDMYLEGAFRKAVRFFEAEAELGMLYSNVVSINAQSEIINLMRYQQFSLADLMAFTIIGQPGVFMRREALESAGLLDTEYHMLLDHHLWLRIVVEYPLVHLDDCLAAARFHPEAKNVAQAEKFSSEAYRLLDWMKNSKDMAESYQANERRIIAGAHSFSARYLLDAGLKREAVRDYFKSLKTDPKTALRSLHRMTFAIVNLVFPLDWAKRIFLSIKKKRAVYLDSGMVESWWKRKSESI